MRKSTSSAEALGPLPAIEVRDDVAQDRAGDDDDATHRRRALLAGVVGHGVAELLGVPDRLRVARAPAATWPTEGS